MTRIAIIMGALVLIIGVSIYIGMRWDRESELNRDIDTLEDIQDAKENAGDCSADWLECLLRHRE